MYIYTYLYIYIYIYVGGCGKHRQRTKPWNRVSCFSLRFVRVCAIWFQVSPSEKKWVQVSPSESKSGQVRPKWVQVSKWVPMTPNQVKSFSPSPNPLIQLRQVLSVYWGSYIEAPVNVPQTSTPWHMSIPTIIWKCDRLFLTWTCRISTRVLLRDSIVLTCGLMHCLV